MTQVFLSAVGNEVDGDKNKTGEKIAAEKKLVDGDKIEGFLMIGGEAPEDSIKKQEGVGEGALRVEQAFGHRQRCLPACLTNNWFVRRWSCF